MRRSTNCLIQHRRLTPGHCVFWLIALVLSAMAHPSAGQIRDENRTERRIEEVIVTAQHREQRLQDVPMAITALGRELLENNEINTIEDLTKLLPSVTLTPDGTPGGGDIRIRGVGSDIFSAAVEANVLVMLDGVPLARTSQASFDFADIERIEVLRGPQGTLFGKNASAGMIHVITRDPTDEFEARARFSYEQPQDFPGDFMKTQATVSGEIIPGLGLRVTGFHKRSHGIYEDIKRNTELPDSEEYGVRSKLRWDPMDTLTARLNLEFQRRDADFTPVPWRSGNPDFERRVHPIQPNARNRQVKTFNDGRADSEGHAASLTLDWDIGGFTVTSITGLRETGNITLVTIDGLDGERIDLNGQFGETDIKTLTQELRITSPDSGRLEYTAGVLWFDNRVDSEGKQRIEDIPAAFVASGVAPPGSPLPNNLPEDLEGLLDGADGIDLNSGSDVRADTRNLGIFAQGTWHVADRWHLTAGARYLDEEVEATVFHKSSELSHASSGATITSSEFPTRRVSVSDTDVIGRLSLQYDWGAHSVLYGTASTGYRGAAFDLAASIGEQQEALEKPVAPETSTNYEMGIKSRLFDDRLELNVTVFLTRFQDFQAQVRDFEDEQETIAVFKLDNAGEMETRGVEVDFRANPIEPLSLFGSFLFNRAVFNEFITQCFSGQGPNERGAIDENGDGTCDAQDVSGGVLRNAPKRSVSLTARYEHTFAGTGHSAYGQITGRWQDEVQDTNEQHPLTIREPFSVWDLRAGWLGPDGRWAVAGYVKNLFGKFYTARLTPISVVNDRRDIAHNIPVDADRVFGLSLEYNWF